jgi:hypothetical protein
MKIGTQPLSHYATRMMTNFTDKLPALSGLASYMQKQRKCTYIAGLWKEDLEYGLLWYVGAPCTEAELSDAMMPGGMLIKEQHSRVGRNLPNGDFSCIFDDQTVDDLSPVGSKFWVPNALVESTHMASLAKQMTQMPISKPLSTVAIAPSSTRGLSWSWSSFDNAKINFLYGQHSLTAGGTPMAKGVSISTVPKYGGGSAFGEICRGYLSLRGAVKHATAVTSKIDSWKYDFECPIVSTGHWTAELYSPSPSGSTSSAPSRTKIGFIALDYDPKDTIEQDFLLLLLRDDDQDPAKHRPAKNGWLRRDSYVPLVFNRLPNGNVLMPGHRKKRFAVALALRPLNKEGSIHTRVGLAQIYPDFWAEEIKNKKKRDTMVIIK